MNMLKTALWEYFTKFLARAVNSVIFMAQKTEHSRVASEVYENFIRFI